MALNVTKTTDTRYDPVFKKILEDIPGGGTLLTDRIPSATKEIKAGALIHAIPTAASLGLFRLVKTAKLQVNVVTAAAVTLIVYVNHEFKVGDYVCKVGGASSATIAAITKAHATAVTGRIVFTAGGGGLNCANIVCGIILTETNAAAATLLKYSAEAILRYTVQVRSADGTTLRNVGIGGVVRGTVNESILPYFVTAADKTALTAIMRWA